MYRRTFLLYLEGGELEGGDGKENHISNHGLGI